MLAQLDADLVALRAVKTRIREIAALLVTDRLRREEGLACARPSLHYHLVTARASVALGGAGSRVDGEPARRAAQRVSA